MFIKNKDNLFKNLKLQDFFIEKKILFQQKKVKKHQNFACKNLKKIL